MTGAEPKPRQPIFNLPPMVQALLAANLLVHGLRLLLPAATDEALLQALGFQPLRYTGGSGITLWAVISPITYQFLHGSLEHLGINMLGLVAFGSGVEQRLGAWRFLVLYLLSGIAGAFAQFAIAPTSPELLIGASAAISGAFGAILRFQVFRRGFWLLVGLWLVLNLATGSLGLGSDIGPVAWVAHIGGFVVGLLLFPLLLPPGRPEPKRLERRRPPP